MDRSESSRSASWQGWLEGWVSARTPMEFGFGSGPNPQTGWVEKVFSPGVGPELGVGRGVDR